MLTVDWSEQIERWLEEARFSRESAKRAARMAWAAEVAAELSKCTAQCAVELELHRRQQIQPGARQSAAAAAEVALLAAIHTTTVSGEADAVVGYVRWQRRQRWEAQYGSLRLYRGVGHGMMERMGWQVGSSCWFLKWAVGGLCRCLYAGYLPMWAQSEEG